MIELQPRRPTMAEDNDRAEINRLYWQTDASVADIADEVGVSRRALYDAIEPRPAGADCPECGAAMGFRNRTALEHGEAECPDCGYETAASPDNGRPAAAEAGAAEPRPAGPRPAAAGAAGPAADRSPRPASDEPDWDASDMAADGRARLVPPAGSGPFMSAAFLIGIVAGVLAAISLRKS